MGPDPPAEFKQPALSFDLAWRVLDSLADGVVVTDGDGLILYANAAEERMFGYERGELVGKHVFDLNTYSPDENVRRVKEAIEHLKERGLWQGQCCSRRKDGSTFYT